MGHLRAGDKLISQGDAITIAEKIIEMAERARVAHAVAPGAVAEWGLILDGTRFRVEVSVAETGRTP